MPFVSSTGIPGWKKICHRDFNDLKLPEIDRKLVKAYSCLVIKVHEYHNDITDSVYQQSKKQAQLYLDLHQMGYYVNTPDEYFFYGANKNGIEYWYLQYFSKAFFG